VLARRSQRATNSVDSVISYHDGRGNPDSRELGDATIGGSPLVRGARGLFVDGGFDWFLCLVPPVMISFCVLMVAIRIYLFRLCSCLS
jgi:hypothetical protein